MGTEEKKKILVVGDSLCKGVSLNEEKNRYFFIKNSFVNNLSAALNVDVVNTAKFGSTIKYGAERLEAHLTNHRPDIVLIEYGGNDCDFIWDEIAEDPYKQHLPKTTLSDYSHYLIAMIAMARRYQATPVVMTLPPLNAVDYFKWFTKGSRKKADSILKWLEDVSKIYWWHERYSSTVVDVAEQCNVPVADVRRSFLRTPDFRTYICSDGIHPNEKGHKLLTASILDCFNKYAECLNL